MINNRILIISNNSNGLWIFRKDLIKQLQTDGKCIYCITPFDHNVEDLEKIGVVTLETKLDRRGVNPFKDLKLLVQYIKYINEIKPSLILTYTIKPNIYGGLVARLSRIPYAVNITGLGSAFENSSMLKAFIIMLYKASLRRAEVVFFENHDNAMLFIKNRIVSKEQTCVLNGAGVDLDRFYVQPYPEEDSIFRFLFIGRVMAEKGIQELLNAMVRLRKDGISCELDILGGLEENYQDVIKKYELEGWLNYKGFQADVRPYIKRSHCFVLPSWHEGMANTILECAASGRPIITSNIPGCKEAIREEISGYLVNPKDSEDLYRFMRKMTKLEKQKRKQMGLEGRKIMEDLFDKKEIVAQTISRLY